MQRTRTLFAAATIAAVTLLAACGDDSSSDGADATDTTAAATDDTSAGGDPVGTEEYCAMIQAYKDKAASFDEVFSSDTPDPAKTEEAFTTMEAMLQELEDNAPAEIAADVATVNGATKALIAVFDEYDWDIAAMDQSTEAQTAVGELMGDQEVAAASDRLDTFGQEKCGIAPES